VRDGPTFHRAAIDSPGWATHEGLHRMENSPLQKGFNVPFLSTQTATYFAGAANSGRRGTVRKGNGTFRRSATRIRPMQWRRRGGDFSTSVEPFVGALVEASWSSLPGPGLALSRERTPFVILIYGQAPGSCGVAKTPRPVGIVAGISSHPISLEPGQGLIGGSCLADAGLALRRLCHVKGGAS